MIAMPAGQQAKPPRRSRVTSLVRHFWPLVVTVAIATGASSGRGSASEALDAWDVQKPPDGIIVLGGGLAEYLKNKRSGHPPAGVAERISVAVALWRRFPTALLVYAGAEPPPGPHESLLAEGIPPASLVIDGQSRNTAQSAVFAARLLKPAADQTWLLVTSGYHMARARRCFEEAGFKVLPAPVQSEQDATQRTLHEWVGRLSYSLLGLCKPDR